MKNYRTINMNMSLRLATEKKEADLVFFHTGEQEVNDEMRQYYVAHTPHLLLLVLRNGIEFSDLQDHFVEALIGWDEGKNSFVTVKGQWHTKITVLGLAVAGDDVEEFTEILKGVPLAGRAGGQRGPAGGRPKLAPGGMVSHNVSLPDHVWSMADTLGHGNLSAGLRRMAEIAEEAS